MMYKTIESYVAMIKVNLKNALAYRMDFILSALFGIALSLLMIFIWTAIYSNSGTNSIGGFSLPTIYTYFFIIAATYALTNVSISDQMQTDIRDGNIAAALVRPVSYIQQVVFGTIGGQSILSVFVVAVPILIIASLLVHLSLSIVSIALFSVEIVIGLGISVLVDMFVGTLAVYLTEVWGLSTVMWAVESLVGGAIIPLGLLPKPYSSIALALPFQLFGYTPAVTLLGTVPMQMILNEILIGLIWLAGLYIFVRFWWKRIEKNLTSVGG